MSSLPLHSISHAAKASPHVEGRWPKFLPAIVLAFLTLLAGSLQLRGYLLPELNALLALISLPFVVYLKRPGRRSWRFAGLALLFLALYPLLHIKITFHLAVCFALLFLAEASLGQFNAMPVSLIFVLSPLPHYFASVLGFPLRLWLSRMAGHIFGLMGMDIEVRGNLFVQNGAEFSVDPACTGINLFVTGLVLFVILLSYQEKRQRKSLHLSVQCLLLVLGMSLVLLANLFRIVSLVLLRSQPETFSHEAVGILCLLVYFCLPMALLIGWAVRRWGRPLPPLPAHPGMRLGRAHMWVSGSLVVGLLLAGWLGHRPPNLQQRLQLEGLEVAGYASCITDDGMLALQGQDALVYLKPPIPFYGADHYPEICWRAGGYAIRAPEVKQVGDLQVMMARLENAEHCLHTAWWYDNGETQTVSTLDWRWQQLRGAPGFFLTNITAGSPAMLECALLDWQTDFE